MKKVIGILAHVDAGKTTFSEQVLFKTHAIRTAGRVDHQDAFLDSHAIEKERGITVFSDQAVIAHGENTWYWVDTPGHVDFSAEMERALSVLDYAVVLLSCVEGIQSHTETVWSLLKDAGIPVFFFLNKTDREGADPDGLIEKIRTSLSGDALDFRNGFSAEGVLSESLREEIAARDESLLEAFLEGSDADWTGGARRLIKERKMFPVFAGSALRDEGVDAFLSSLDLLTETDWHEDEPFSARVYKIRHDAQGVRQTFIKVLSGRLKVREETDFGKISEIRLYHGAKYRTVDSVGAGDLCALSGVSGLMPGDGMGSLSGRRLFQTEPMMMAGVLFDAGIRLQTVLDKLKILEAEEPALGVEEHDGRIDVHVMGPIQLEILKELMKSRFSLEIGFGPCRVRYRETIVKKSLGIGHFEPLRHYAEVHLLLEPGERGSGITFETRCHVDELELNWQRLIETHVFETQHRGVLTGSPITDIKIILISGRAHLKHTEGGDFRESTYRAISNGLMYAENIVLEPICRFTAKAPEENMGSLTAALLKMQADIEPPVLEMGECSIEGKARMADLATFPAQLAEMTHGRGHIVWRMDHYEPCRDQAAVIEASGYRTHGEGNSMFCAKGAGFAVVWDKVRDFAHITPELGLLD